MGRLLRNTDILAGLGAVVLLAVLVFLLKITLPISIALAFVAYIGLRLLLPKTDAAADAERQAAVLAQCDDRVTTIGQLAGWAGFAGKATVRERLLTIARTAQRILSAIKQDESKQSLADKYLTEYLDPITAVLSSYVKLAGRDLTMAQDDLTALENQTLPLIERRLNLLYEQIHSADVAALELNARMLEYTLQPISMARETSMRDALPDLAERGRQSERATVVEPAVETTKEQAG